MEGGIVLFHWSFLFKAYRQRRRERTSQNSSEETDIQKPEERGELGFETQHTDVPLNPIFRPTSQEKV
jgi:hypothetical protein